MAHYGLSRAVRSIGIVAVLVSLAACGDDLAEVAGDASVVTSALTPSPDSNCSSATSAGREYWFCSTERSWAVARQKCQAVAGRDLVVIESATENTFVYQHVPDDSWIGATDQTVEGAWRWAPSGVQFWQGTAGGLVVGGAYTKWKSGQPNETGGQDCAIIDDSDSGKWSDESCSGSREYVCEADNDQCPNDPNKTSPGQCGCGVADTDGDGDGTANCVDGCSSDPNKTSAGQCGCGTADTDSDGDSTADCNDGCPNDAAHTAPDCSPESGCTRKTFGASAYWFCNSTRNWSTARTKCTAAGYQFARIESAAENDFIEDEISSDRWIGGSDITTEGTWRWEIGGTTFWQGDDDGSAVGGAVTMWDSSEPSTSSSHDCLQVMGDGEWNADDCGNTEQYICEDMCPSDTSKSLPGPCGCGTPEVDSNNDGNPDCLPRPGDPGLPQFCRGKEFEGRDYVFCDQQLTWDDARAMCQSMDMDLLVVDSAPENQFATTEVDSPAWTAANDKLAEGEWRWVPTGVEFWRGGVDGRRESTYYENWAVDAPGSNTRDCGTIDAQGEWQDDNCAVLHDVACEQRGLDNFVAGLAPAAGCMAETYGNQEYWVCPSAKTYFEARNACTAVGGFDLASVETDDENAFLASKVPTGQQAWVGGNDVKQDGQWQWVSVGTSFWTGGASGNPVSGAYTRWATNEPSTSSQSNDCTTTQSAGTWSARDCDTAQGYFICEAVVLSWTAPDGQSEAEELPPPLSDSASAQLAQGFSWSATSALPELDPDGNPSLHYVMVYLKTSEERDALDAARVSYSFEPYFDEERDALWGGQVGIHMHELDDAGGIFAYGIMLGRAYNMVRSAALLGEDVWDAVILRDPPASVQRHPVGSITYTALSDVGYEPPPDPIPADALSAAGAGGTTSMTVWQDMAEGFEDMADWFREGRGNLRERVQGDTRITVRVVPHDVSENFPGENNRSCPHSSCMPTLKRAWGRSAGLPIELPGVNIIIKGKGTHTGRTGEYGSSWINVANNTDYDVCLQLENTNAEVATNFVATEAVLCDYRANVVADAVGTFSLGNEISEKQVGRYNSFTIHAFNRYVQTLALATDADYFMRDIISVSANPESEYVHLPIRAKILTGKHAGIFQGADPVSYAPCRGLPMPGYDAMIAGLQWSGLLLLGPVEWAIASIVTTPLAKTDIMLQPADAKRRGVIVHEWGHYAACKMLLQVHPEIATEQLRTLWHKADEQADQQPTAMAAEGFADFFASQVVGGVNYFWTREGGRSGDDKFMWYCDPNLQLSLGDSPATRVGACLDDNIGGPSARTSTTLIAKPFQHRIGRWTSTLLDIFDGQHQPGPNPLDQLHSGAAWVQNSSGFTGSVVTGDLPRPCTTTPCQTVLCDPEPMTRKDDRDEWTTSMCGLGGYVPDEEISLDGPDIYQLFKYWADDVVERGSIDGATIRDDTWGRSIARLLQDRGYTDEQICRVFALHQEDGACPSDLPMARNAVPSRPYNLVGTYDSISREGTWRWKDKSPVATGYEYSIDEISDQGTSTGTGGSMPVPPFQADGVHREGLYVSPFPLHPDATYRFRVAAVNGSVVGPYAEHQLTTPPELIGSVECEALEEAVDVDWRDGSGQAFEGGRFQLQYRPLGTVIWLEGRTVTGDDDVDGFFALTANDQIHGLDSEREYEVRVVPLTRDGTLSVPSPVEACTPNPPTELFVSAASGDDAHVSAGSLGHPFETLQAAVEAANALDEAVWIRVASGTYTSPQVVQVLKKSEMATVRITGGYDEALGWTRGGAPTTIHLQGLAAVNESGPGDLPAHAALVVDNDVLLKLQDLTVVVEPPGWISGCVAGVYAEHLYLETTTLSTAGVEGSCRIAIQGYVKSLLGPDLIDSGLIRIREGSRVFGIDAGGDSASDGITSYGIYSEGPEVIATDSVVAAITEPGYAGTGPSVLIGIAVGEDEPHVNALGSEEAASGQALTVARSFVETAYRDPNFAFSSGFQAAVLSSTRRTTIHNSLLRSAIGGSTTTALATSGNNREVDVFYSTLIVGDDNEGSTTRPAGFRGAVYTAFGSARRFECRNNALVYAAGIGPSNSVATIFDFEELTSSQVFHQRLDVTANVFSNLFSPIVFCSFDETVGVVASEESSNSGAVYSCLTTPFAGAYVAAWNRKHYRPLVPGPDVGAGIATFDLDGFFEPEPSTSLSTTEHMRGQLEWLTSPLEPEIDRLGPIMFDLGRRFRTFNGGQPNLWDGSANDVGARVFGL